MHYHVFAFDWIGKIQIMLFRRLMLARFFTDPSEKAKAVTQRIIPSQCYFYVQSEDYPKYYCWIDGNEYVDRRTRHPS